MKLTTRKLKLAWKYRAPLWRYRKIIRTAVGARREIGTALAAAGAMLAAGVLVKRAHRI